MRTSTLIPLLFFVASPTFGQSSNGEGPSFEELNDRIEKRFDNIENQADSLSGRAGPVSSEAVATAEYEVDIPTFGWAIVTEDGDTVDVLGGDAPTVTANDGSIVGFRNYKLPENATIEMIGAADYASFVAESENRAVAELRKAVIAFDEASRYLRESFCQNTVRPSSITLSLTAEFKIIIGGSTGAEATWDFAEICTSDDQRGTIQ